MYRTVRYPLAFVLALLSIAMVVPTSARATAAGPVLTAVAVGRGTIAVTGRGFTPGGRVRLALFDAWGSGRYETRWTAASPSTYGRDGSADPAAGFVAGGTLGERFDRLCGDSALVRAYDQDTFAYSEWLEVDLSEFRSVSYGPDGSAGPALGFSPVC